ncbi:uncharacterized protein [Rutidosis leptorrhynchoides]|uniref:uncharacterized protein n=1 Tax=Rutidosis leptorrhynchoides TaxID=125765 RepID=UPI003A99A7E9
MSGKGDGLDHLRIPFDKIKFGKKLEVEGYGSVFQGEYDNQHVALKQLNITNLANIKPKLLDEILVISRFRQHPNLVALLGFSDEKSNEIILVYEYVPSGNLADKMRKRLTTIQRLEICLDAARGLDYLHTGVDKSTPGIVHGNIKTSKILLKSKSNSSRLEAKVSSFGLSKIIPGKSQKNNLESMKSDDDDDEATKASDVYSFGVMLLEVLCGVSELVDTDDFLERHVTELVPKKMEQNKLRKIIHRDMRKDMTTESLETYAKIACQCTIENPEERPTMRRVVEELEKALRLQGGEVSYVDIPTIIGKDLITDNNLEVAGEDTTRDEINIDGTTTSVSTDPNEFVDNTPQIATMEEQEQIHDVLTLASSDVDNVMDNTHIEEAEKETVIIGTNIDPPETPGIIIAHNSNSDNESNMDGENRETMKLATASQFSSVDTTVPQGGNNVFNVQSLSSSTSSNGDGVSEGTINTDINHVGDNNCEMMSSDMTDKQSEVKIVSSEETTDKIAVEEQRSYNVPPIPDSVDDSESLPEAAAETRLEEEEEEEDTHNIMFMSTNDPQATKQVTDDLKFNPNSNSSKENIDDNHNTKPVDNCTNPSDNSTQQNSGVLKSSSSSNFDDDDDDDNDDDVPYKNHDDEEIEDELEQLRIPYDKIKFGKKIDARGYGSLFAGELDVRQVALKRLNITNLSNIKPKLLAEIVKVARFRNHPNVVALIGFCDEKKNEIILVYEYVSDGNLADKMSKHLTTIQRLEICLGAARGLDYLHTGVDSATPGIVHGDIRLSKILINSDSSLSVRISCSVLI